MQMKNNTSKPYIILLTVAAIITVILFYIDEGYYNFNWMLDWGNWIVYLIYVAVIFAVEAAIYKLLSLIIKSKSTTILSATLGVMIALPLLFFVIF